MMTHRMRIRQQLRSIRSAALTCEERRQEMLAAQLRIAQHNGRTRHPGDTADGDPARKAHDAS